MLLAGVVAWGTGGGGGGCIDDDDVADGVIGGEETGVY